MVRSSRQHADRGGRRVLIVDDNPQVRQELRTLLPLAGNIQIIGEAADGLQAIHLLQTLEPEVVLIDLEMPLLDGYEATRQIKAYRPTCRVVALTAYDDPESRDRAAQAGVDAFIVKGGSVASLVQAITGTAV